MVLVAFGFGFGSGFKFGFRFAFPFVFVFTFGFFALFKINFAFTSVLAPPFLIWFGTNVSVRELALRLRLHYSLFLHTTYKHAKIQR